MFGWVIHENEEVVVYFKLPPCIYVQEMRKTIHSASWYETHAVQDKNLEHA